MGRGRGEEETLTRKAHDSGKRPLIFHGSVDLQIDSSSKVAQARVLIYVDVISNKQSIFPVRSARCHSQ